MNTRAILLLLKPKIRRWESCGGAMGFVWTCPEGHENFDDFGTLLPAKGTTHTLPCSTCYANDNRRTAGVLLTPIPESIRRHFDGGVLQ